MSNESIVLAPYKEIWEFIYNKGKSPLCCRCGALVAYIGKVNFQNKNYDVLQAKDCTCPRKANPIPFLDKNSSQFKFSDDNWQERKCSDAANVSNLYVIRLAIPADPVYKLVEVENGRVRYSTSIPLTEAEKVKYYEKLMREKRSKNAKH